MGLPITPLDLSYRYLQKFHTTQPTITEIRECTAEICTLLKSGWIDKDLWLAIEGTVTKVPIVNLVDGRKKSIENILDPYRYYYHNQLRVVPAPQVAMEDDELVQGTGEFFLEMRASYTLRQMAKYFIAQFKIAPEDVNMERYIGSFSWLIKKNDIDLILYMIDAHSVKLQEEDKTAPDTPMSIADSKEEARILLGGKKTQSKESGDDKFVPRKRKLVFASDNPSE